MKSFIDDHRKKLFLESHCEGEFSIVFEVFSFVTFSLGSPFAHLFKKSETVVLGYQGLFEERNIFLFFLKFFHSGLG